MLLEVGPGTTLLGLARRTADDDALAAVPTLRPGIDESLTVAEAVGHLWTLGVAIDWSRYQERRRRPTHRPAHLRVPARAPLGGGPERTPRRGEGPTRRRDHPLLGHRLVEAGAAGVSVWEGALDLASFPYLADHRVQGRVIVPATAYLEMAIAAATEAFGAQPLTLSRIKLHAPLALDDDTVARTQTMLAGLAEIGETDVRGAEPRVGRRRRAGLDPARLGPAGARREAESTLDLAAIRARCPDEVAGDEFYRRLAERGNDWGPCFRGLPTSGAGPTRRSPRSGRRRRWPAISSAIGSIRRWPTPPATRSPRRFRWRLRGPAGRRLRRRRARPLRASAGRRTAGSSRTPAAATPVAPTTC